MTSEEINREIARIELITDAKERSREASMLRQRIASENEPVVKMGKGIKVTEHMLKQSQQEIQTKDEFEENYVKDAVSGAPGALGGSLLASATNMHPLGRIVTPIVGAIASSPYVKPYSDKLVDALNDPENKRVVPLGDDFDQGQEFLNSGPSIIQQQDPYMDSSSTGVLRPNGNTVRQ